MAQTFWITKDRVVDGRYIRATPENPVQVTFKDKFKVKLLCDCGAEQIAIEEKKSLRRLVHEKDCNATKPNGRPEDPTLARVEQGKPQTPPKESLVPHFAATRPGPSTPEEAKRQAELEGGRPSDRDPAAE